MPIAKNKKAYFDLEILDTFDTGIVLQGCEVKAIRQNKINLKGSFISTDGKDIFVENIHISPYQAKNQPDYKPKRKRKLLLNRKEIDKLISTLNEKGVTIVPLEVYFKRNLIKIKIGVGRGRKKYDKRALLKKKAQDLEVRKALKRAY